MRARTSPSYLLALCAGAVLCPASALVAAEPASSGPGLDPAVGAGTVVSRTRGPVALPRGDVFPPLLADPKQPRFAATLVWADQRERASLLAAVVFGESAGIVRWGERERGLQVDLAGAVFAQFDMLSASTALVNADYTIGVPVTLRRKAWSARARIYHQSSHLGDEYLLGEQPRRVNFNYLALELLVAMDRGDWRWYGGGEYLFHRSPADVPAVVPHVGAEYRSPRPLWRLADQGSAGWVLGFDLKSQGTAGVDLCLRAGLAFTRADDTAGRGWSVLLEYYDGTVPYGQFYAERTTYTGMGVHFTL